MTKTKGGGIHFPVPKGKHGARAACRTAHQGQYQRTLVPRSAIVVGATGLVGSKLVDVLLADPA